MVYTIYLWWFGGCFSCLESLKDNIFCPGLDMFFVRYVFFPNTAMSGCKPSTCRSIVFLKSLICRTGSDSMSVSSRDSIWGSMLTSDVENILVFYDILWVHPNLVGNMVVFVARFWVPYHDSQCASLRAEIPPLETVGGCPHRCCQRIWTTIHNQKPKYAIEQKNVRYG